ncbi:hypothetical protein CI238_10366 [Colletotrichum incanum]|uniref:Uncharacterized protein n=1 Tax=Colletotrichum incanum TaxID=1573173 RepID=A0A161XSH3_COLIC|nr:hypothetical protein CI238_10366 [Colletotrichum incanum]
MVENQMRAKEGGDATWRCRAVTKDLRNAYRVRIACRTEEEHTMVNTWHLSPLRRHLSHPSGQYELNGGT